MISWCWPNGKLAFPDYLNEKTHTWWENSVTNFVNDEINGCDMVKFKF